MPSACPVRKLADGRLYLPAEEPYLEGHNTSCVNVPGSLLVIPVADIAQHLIATLCFFTQNGYALHDDVNDREITALAEFRRLVDVDEPLPLTFAEQYALTEATAELATACYAGVLLLQAMGLGGWMFDGIGRDPRPPTLRPHRAWLLPAAVPGDLPRGRPGRDLAFGIAQAWSWGDYAGKGRREMMTSGDVMSRLLLTRSPLSLVPVPVWTTRARRYARLAGS